MDDIKREIYYLYMYIVGPLSYVSPVALEAIKSDKEIVWHFRTPLVITTAKYVLDA